MCSSVQKKDSSKMGQKFLRTVSSFFFETQNKKILLRRMDTNTLLAFLLFVIKYQKVANHELSNLYYK